MKEIKIDTDKNFYCIDELKVNFYFDEDFDGYILESAEGFSEILYILSKINGKPIIDIEFCDWNAYGYNRVEIFGNSNYFRTIDGVLFTYDMKELLIYPPEKTDKNYIVPNGVEIAMEDSLNNKYIENIIFPTGFTEFAQYSIAVCKNLKTIFVPKSLEKVLLKAFYWNENLKDILYEGSKSDWNKIFIADCNESLENANIHFNSISGD